MNISSDDVDLDSGEFRDVNIRTQLKGGGSTRNIGLLQKTSSLVDKIYLLVLPTRINERIHFHKLSILFLEKGTIWLYFTT